MRRALPAALAFSLFALAAAPARAQTKEENPAKGEEAAASPSAEAPSTQTNAPKSTPSKKSPRKKSTPPASSADLRKAQAEIEALKARLAAQDAVVAKQDETIRALEERLAKLEALAKAGEDRLKAMERETPEQAAALPPTLEERLKKLETEVSQLPEAADVVSVGDFPGSFRIPGTDAALKLGGQVRVTAVESLDAIGTDDRFVTSSIPVEGSEAAGKGARTTLSAEASRFNFDFRTPTGVGAMRAFIEVGFAGSQGAILRHAFGQWDRWILGQTWSTFSDPEAEPFGIDNEGLNAISLFRQPQIRYTAPLWDSVTLAAALENPAPDVTNASGVNLIPDVVLRLRWTPQKGIGSLPVLGQLGHVQAAVLLRQIRAESDVDHDQTASRGGFGLGVSGVLRTGWWSETDDIKFSTYFGKGIGRYITDLQTAGGQDAYFDLATGEMTALGVTAAYVGYEHAWSPTLRSTATLGWVWVNVLESQPNDALKYTRRFSLNLAWSPIPRLDLVGELLTGTRVNKDLQSGDATQIQLGSRFRF
ncbi:MAG TPA: DcaP family trimeric outer membrane transporter [Thermoanaerobaculia bacterium]|nr:DcaP family trimeric outer membrane transporter [Thermoanaerobaculia bacterium]